ncbi:uncharacterized protein LOC143862046 [Tasmannia lanceolata]|uniref:uncharacterized protein LOC143862046 n=1 Tax=Tasmannia lanceolata TaxID=3420 RepID=UPI0040646FE5
MDASEDGYKPPSEFQEDTKEPLVEISLTGSTELWLIQWPINHLEPKDFEGKELSLKLHHDGRLGSFESSSGKSYDLVSFAAQAPDATVFLSSSSKSKVVGKISRRVCLVHYPEPTNLEKPSSTHPNRSSQRSAGSSRMDMSHHSATPAGSGWARSSQTTSGPSRGLTTPTRSSKQRDSGMISGTSFESVEPSKNSKKRHVERPPSPDESARSMGRSTGDSIGWEGRSSISSPGSSKHSHRAKSKRRIKVEE